MFSPNELIRALAVFGEPPAEEHAAVADALGLGPPPGSAEHTELFSMQLYPYASVHLGPEGMLGGVARDRVAGFWRAFAHTPPAEPDHLTALLGLYASLADHAAAATGAEGALLEQGRAALLHEHLAPWLFFYLRRVEETAGSFHARWAALLGEALAREVRRAPVAATLPIQLREAPGLPDPRRKGGRAFLEGLLAPVRSGLMITRGDLSRLARSLGLGVRMGERRYVLEHLLGQEPAGVLAALAAEADAEARRHARLESLLGAVATFWCRRARRSSALLAELSAEGSPTLAAAAEERVP